MEHLTPWEVCVVVVGALLALAGFINTVGAAIDRIAKARQAAQAPNKAQDDRLAELERRMGDVERKVGNDKRSLDKITDGLEASFQVQLALLDHALNGNNIKQMQDARDVLYNHLTHPNKRKE
jgi:hypothetical protein